MSDWWTQPSTPARGSAFHTPGRGGAPSHSHALHHSQSQNLSSSRARFVNDDPDPSAADGPKFLPSFAASPAGKLALGSSPGSTASPPAPKRSPVARFSVSAESTSSPLRSLGSRSAPVPMDEDPIPTSSLHDESPPRIAPPQAAEASIELPLPPALEPGMNTTTLHVFGPPVEYLAALRPYLENIGPVVSYEPGPEGSNWWTVQYGDALAASYALRRHGEIVSGRWMLAFKVAGPGSTQGLTLVNGVSSSVVAPSGGAGHQIQIKSANIVRAKPKAAVVKDEYAWEEPEQQQSGILGRAAEFIFGR